MSTLDSIVSISGNIEVGTIIRGQTPETIVSSKGTKDSYLRVSAANKVPLPACVVIKAQKDKRDFGCNRPILTVLEIMEHVALGDADAKTADFYRGLIYEVNRQQLVAAYSAGAVKIDWNLAETVEFAMRSRSSREESTLNGDDFKLLIPALVSGLTAYFKLEKGGAVINENSLKLFIAQAKIVLTTLAHPSPKMLENLIGIERNLSGDVIYSSAKSVLARMIQIKQAAMNAIDADDLF